MLQGEEVNVEEIGKKSSCKFKSKGLDESNYNCFIYHMPDHFMNHKSLNRI
jgi:hypothetical protein